MVVCGSCTTQNPDGARFCGACGAALEVLPPPEHERRLVTVVFVDVVDAAGAAEPLDPEEVRRRLDRYFGRLRAELERFGGTLEKFIGDAVVAMFGTPVAHGDDAQRAVRGALAALGAIDALNAEDPSLALIVRIGVNTGEALVAVGARPREGEGIAWGDVVNTAARIQLAAAPGTVLVGEQTWRASRRSIDYRAHAPIAAKGKTEPVPVWQAVGVAAGPAATRPLVGRDNELAALDALWRDVVGARRAALALVTGPAGIGKSRLVTELERLSGRQAWRGRCLPYGEGITYWPIIELLQQATGVRRDDSAEDVDRKLRSLLARLPADPNELRTIAAAIANLLDLAATPTGAEISNAELRWGLRRFLELAATERPLLVVLEDLEWAEPTLLELIDFVVEEGAGPVLLACAARSELGELQPRLHLQLEPLDDGASEELLHDLLGEAPSALVERAEGNPLFLEELASAYSEGNDSVPSTLQALIGARLDALPDPVKRVVQHAAVCGMVFWPVAVAAITQADDLESELAELERRQLIRRQASTLGGEQEWSFRHLLIREVAYGRLPKARRARLHERFAGWMAELGGADDLIEIRAWHLEQACLLAREPRPVQDAVEALTAAGEKAERREGSREADRFYERALALEDPTAITALDLRFRRARLVSVLADHAAAAAALAPIADEAGSRGLSALRAAALTSLANVELKQGAFETARVRLSEAEELAKTANDQRLALRVAFELALLRSWSGGHIDDVVDDQRALVAAADALGERALEVDARVRLATVLYNVGMLAESDSVLEETAALAESLGSLRDEARVTWLQGVVDYFRVGADAAESGLTRGADWLALAGDAYIQIQTLCWLAKCALRRGDLAPAEQRLHEALPAALGAGGWLVVEVYRQLIEIVLTQGRADEARGLLKRSRAAAPAADPYAAAALLVSEALVANVAGDVDAMKAAFVEAIDSLVAQGLQVDAAEARLTYARVADTTEAWRAAREAFERIGAASFVGEIDAHLHDVQTAGLGRQ